MVAELEASQAQIERVLQSKAFRSSEVQRNLLAYLAEKSLAGTADSLKEYTVGLDVFSKPASYDPRQESVVRMHMARLRQKLAEYYRSEGAGDPILIELPKGGFKVTFEPRPSPAPIAEPASPPGQGYPRERILVAALILAMVCAVYFGIRWWLSEKASSGAQVASATPWTPELQQLWAPFLTPDRPLMLCLATPSYGVTGVGTAKGAFLLGQFFADRKTGVVITRSDQLTVPETAMGNVVYLGPMAGNRQVQAIPIERQIILEPSGIRNLNPHPGEPELITDVPPHDLQDVEESYALVSHVPGVNGTGEVLYISGNQVSSVLGGVQALTDPSFARMLVSKLKTAKGGLPQYYQVVLKVRAMDDTPVDISYMLHRELPAK
jgi:hypothetical protein